MKFEFALFLSCSLIFLSSSSPQANAIDTLLNAGHSIRDAAGETLVSAGDIFELGFFSPGSSTNRYVGIWYYNFSTDSVLWVANRENPVKDRSGTLAIAADGNLVVLDGQNNMAWSSNVSLSSNASTTVQLLSNGNLVINESGGFVWQSFDHPTDTYLPGMKVGLDLRTNVNQVITSWKSEDDPAPGNFTLGIDPKRSTQIFIWEGNKPRWRSGRWNGQVFIGIQGMVPMYIYGFKLSNFMLEQKMYFYYTAVNSSHRYILTSAGLEEHLIRKKDRDVWDRYWAQPVTECELYNRCGNSGSCTDQDSPEICACLKGHVPADKEKWQRGNWSGGCVRKTPFQCEREGTGSGGNGRADGFWKMEQVKLPDLSDWDDGATDEQACRAACLSNCSCTAYAMVDGIGCLRWGGELVDIHIFSSGGNDMYLRLAGSELEEKGNKTASFVVTIIVLSVGVSMGCIFLFWKYTSRRRKHSEHWQRQDEVGSFEPNIGHGGTEFSEKIQTQNEVKEGNIEELPLMSFDVISAATSNFSDLNLLGGGGFGPVYKGVLPGGQEIAVKRLSRNSGQGQEEFKNEVILIAKLQHRNLVRLLGYSIQGEEEKLLVYEYMPNRSLDAFLFNSRKKELLDWKTRYGIIKGIARGLLYLHRDSRFRIIHRDLKVSNILLDRDMNPKISDFGMARIFGNDDKVTNTRRVAGTYGYMSPEYAMQGIFSVKSDVYSFGVLLLEIVSGKRNSIYTHPDLSLNLLGYAWKMWNEDNVMEFVDPAMRNSCSVREVSRCVNVGLLCVQDRPNERPTMSSVIVMLESGTAANHVPRQPTFAAERNPSETESWTFNVAANDSITILTGR